MRLDLVVTDIQMPGSLHGLDLVRYVRAHHPQTRTIVMPGHALDADSRGHGDAFLPKPFRPTELREAIKRLLFGWKPSNPTPESRDEAR